MAATDEEKDDKQFIKSGLPCYMNDTCIDKNAKCCQARVEEAVVAGVNGLYCVPGTWKKFSYQGKTLTVGYCPDKTKASANYISMNLLSALMLVYLMQW